MNSLVRHLILNIAVLLVCLVLPFLWFSGHGAHFAGLASSGAAADAVSGASLVIPDQPGGTFYVLLNMEKHPDTVTDWENFFSEQPVDVIMEDIQCFVSFKDVPGRELADRYAARLAQNQMQVREEDGTLIVSRAENGLFDVIILSQEAEAAYNYSAVFGQSGVRVIPVVGEDTK